jgi:hypothetical protein
VTTASASVAAPAAGATQEKKARKPRSEAEIAAAMAADDKKVASDTKRESATTAAMAGSSRDANAAAAARAKADKAAGMAQSDQTLPANRKRATTTDQDKVERVIQNQSERVPGAPQTAPGPTPDGRAQ